MKILIIEDEVIWQTKFQVIIESCEFTDIILANNIDNAITLLKTHHIDLVVADILLGEEIVFDLYKTYKKAAKIATVFVTTMPTNENYAKAAIVEHFLFLEKPFTQNTFKSALQLFASKKISFQSTIVDNTRLLQHQFNDIFNVVSDTKLLEKLNIGEREVEFITDRLKNNKTFTEIASEKKVSAELARKVYNRGISRLKAQLKNAGVRYTHFLEFTKLKKNKLEINKNITENNLLNKKDLQIDFLNQNIDALELLGTKWKNVLHERNIHKIEDLIKLNKRQMLLLPKFGAFAVSQIELELSKNGLELKK